VANLFNKLFGKDEPEEITIVAEVVLGRSDEPARLASGAGVIWRPQLQEEWDKRYSRCSGCRVWIKGRRAVWCEVCKNKGL
jgi:hypothetical protein